jgi:tetratricopeptide (TPR) repeat protein
MKRSITRIGPLILVATLGASGCGVINRIRAKNELNEAARSYKEGKFAEAQQHSERSLELDPNQKTAPSFIARSIHAQYKQGVETQQNLEKANQAIEAYKRILERDKNNDEAYKAVAALYGFTGQSDKQLEWINTRAHDESVDPVRRADAYVFLASKDWQCSFNVTELKVNQQTVNKDGKTIIQFKKPSDPKEYEQAQQCAAKGLEEVETAIRLDPNSERAWGYKTNLLLESAKLAEMDGNKERQAQFKKQADEAQARTKELSDRKKEEEAKKKPSPASGT